MRGSAPHGERTRASEREGRPLTSAEALNSAASGEGHKTSHRIVGGRSPSRYWDRKGGGAKGRFAWFGSQPGSKILAVSACMPRFEAVLADAEVRRPRVACDPQMKDGSKQLSRKSSAIRLQPDRGPHCSSERSAPFNVRTAGTFLYRKGVGKWGTVGTQGYWPF